jgi:hypothetical protein
MNLSTNNNIDTSIFKKSVTQKNQQLLDTNWNQQWTKISSIEMHDQYGFNIQLDDSEERPFLLSHRGIQVARCHRLMSAKLIACVMMNDILMFKDSENIPPMVAAD